MAINATKKVGGEDIEPIEEGSYPARIYQIIHIGTIAGFQGTMQNKARITFELPTELKVFNEEKGEQPRVISQDYTLSFHEKATLTKVINACDPKALKIDDDGFIEEFDIEQLMGKTCLVNIIHKKGKEDKIYANVSSCMALPKGMICPPAINEPSVLNYDNWNEELFEKLPDFLKDKIKSSDEYKAMKGIIEQAF